jgi:hypothetical protein
VPKWSPTTLLRELEDFQESDGWKDDAPLGEVKQHLRKRIADDALAASRARREKQGQSPLPEAENGDS